MTWIFQKSSQISCLDFKHVGRNSRFDRVLASEEDVLLEDVLLEDPLLEDALLEDALLEDAFLEDTLLEDALLNSQICSCMLLT